MFTYKYFFIRRIEYLKIYMMIMIVILSVIFSATQMSDLKVHRLEFG